jgi:hypothetical protein
MSRSSNALAQGRKGIIKHADTLSLKKANTGQNILTRGFLLLFDWHPSKINAIKDFMVSQ